MISRAVNLTKLADIEQLSQRVIRILGQNPSPMTLLGTNSYLIGTGTQRLLLDTSSPDTPRYLELLEKVLQDTKSKISAILLTHHHYDHLGMVADILAQKQLAEANVPVFKMLRQTNDSDSYNFQFQEFNLSKDIVVQGATMKPIATPGHCDDHISFKLCEENAVFIGDAILGEGSTTFDDLYDYMASLKEVAKFKPDKLYPGHGPLIEDGQNRIGMYISHRETREKQIVSFMEQQEGKEVTTRSFVSGVYPDIPADNEIILHAAGENVNLHLDKLVKDGRVICLEKANDPGLNLWQLVKKSGHL